MNLAPTCTLDEATGRGWDVAIVGAGPAGSVAACELARRGSSVLLIDAATFPRMKVCGCCLNGGALAALATAGLGELPARLGAVPLSRFRLGASGRSAELLLPAGVSLSREAFDAALIRAAVERGANFLPGTRAALVEMDDPEWRHLRLTQSGASVIGAAPEAAPGSEDSTRGYIIPPFQGSRQSYGAGPESGGRHNVAPGGVFGTRGGPRGDPDDHIRARVVLAADGLGGGLLTRAGLDNPVLSPTSHIGAGTVLSPTDTFASGVIHMASGSGGYVGLVRLEDGRLDVAAAFDPAAVRRAGGLGELAALTLTEAGWPLPPGLLTAAWRGTPALTRQRRRVAHHRLFVLGDAAGYVEPFTGEGMAWAMTSAVAVAPLAHIAAAAWHSRLADAWHRRHRHAVRNRQTICRLTAALLRRPWLVRPLVALLARLPGLARPFVATINRPGPGCLSPSALSREF